jgi:pimeloyl-ACP methyl ester carboxylesterase
MLDDVAIIIESLGQPKENIILFGRSIGSIYALHGASLYPDTIGGLIIESGIADVRERILMRVTPKEIGVAQEQFDAECHKYFDHKSKLQSFHGKTLIMHTRHDTIVDVENTRELYEWANQPKRLNLFDHGGHNSILELNTKEYLNMVDSFVYDV